MANKDKKSTELQNPIIQTRKQWLMSRAIVAGTLSVVVLATGCDRMRRPADEHSAPWDPTHIDEMRVYDHEGRFVGPDCNDNGITDWLETSATRFGFIESRGPFPVDDPPVQVLTADLDGNGVRDLVTLNNTNTDAEDGSLSIIRDHSISDNELVSERIRLPESPWVTAMTMGDMDEDGDVDIAVLYETRDYVGVNHYTAPALRVLLNAGDGTFTTPFPQAIGNRYDTPYGFISADLDGDRDLDLVLTRKDAEVIGDLEFRVSILTNQSNEGDPGIFTGPTNIATLGGLPGAQRGSSALATAHIDDDGDLEVIVPYCLWGVWPEIHCGAPSGIAVLSRRSYGSSWDKIEISLDDQVKSLEVADLNRDGRPDLVLSRHDANDLVILFNTGSGDISPTNSDYFADPVAYEMGGAPWAFRIVDLNNDGNPDLVAPNKDSDNVSVRLNLGDGRFSRRATYPAGDGSSSVAASRLGSGLFRDLAIANATSRNVTLLWNESVAARSLDCNRNRSPDSCDIADGISTDTDRNGIPDECPSLRLPSDFHPVDSGLPK